MLRSATFDPGCARIGADALEFAAGGAAAVREHRQDGSGGLLLGFQLLAYTGRASLMEPFLEQHLTDYPGDAWLVKCM